MIRAVSWACGAAARAGLCLTLAVATLSAGELLAQEALLPVLPPASEPAPAAAPQAPSPGASRLLGQLEDGVEAPEAVSGSDGIPACPRDVLTGLLADAADEDDALAALAIEREMLKLCHGRQKVIADVYQMDARLEELWAPPGEKAEPAAAEADAPGTAPVLLSRLTGGAAGGEAGEAEPGAQPTGPRETKLPPPPSFVWFSIIGSGADLRAGVTDGSGVWFVRVGDPLPGGGRIERIGVRPPGVWIAGVEDALLPYGPAPGAVATP